MGRQEDVWRTLGGGIDFANRQRLAELDQSRSGAANPHPLTCLQLGPILHANGQWGMLLRFLTCNTQAMLPPFDTLERSATSRLGKERVRSCQSSWVRYHSKKKKLN